VFSYKWHCTTETFEVEKLIASFNTATTKKYWVGVGMNRDISSFKRVINYNNENYIWLWIS